MVNKAILFLVSTLLMIGCGNTKKNDVKSNIENNWILSHISWVDDRDYLPDSYLQRYDSISEIVTTVQGAKQSIIYYTIDKSGNFLLSTSGTKGHKK